MRPVACTPAILACYATLRILSHGCPFSVSVMYAPVFDCARAGINRPVGRAAAWIWSISPQTMPMTTLSNPCLKHMLSRVARTIRAMDAQRTAQVHSTSKCALSLVPLRYLPAMPLCAYFLMDVLSLSL